VARSLAGRPISGLRVSPNASLSATELERVHAPEYVQAVRTGEPRALAESQGFAWDPQLWTMVCASNGGVVSAARAALRSGRAGALASGLHHARRSHGAGFCTFNGLALAALAALDLGAKRVLVLDLDAHCGGGTDELLGRHPGVRIVDIAVNEFDRYEPGPGNRLELVERASDYLPTLKARLDALENESFGLVLYNAGMDPHQDCPSAASPAWTNCCWRSASAWSSSGAGGAACRSPSSSPAVTSARAWTWRDWWRCTGSRFPPR
jgi:acetoin utilization deacetylase AcuC-like enzyme